MNVSYYRFATFFDINIRSSGECLSQAARDATHSVSRQVDSNTAKSKIFKYYKPELCIWKTLFLNLQLRRAYLSILLSVQRIHSKRYVYYVVKDIPFKKTRDSECNTVSMLRSLWSGVRIRAEVFSLFPKIPERPWDSHSPLIK